MKNTARNIAIKSITLLMIGVIGLLIVNKAVFLHVHKLNDGTIIEHAHPFSKSNDSNPIKSHHHSNADFLFFHNLEILFPLFIIAFALIAFVDRKVIFFKLKTLYLLPCVNQHQGRAPPFLY